MSAILAYFLMLSAAFAVALVLYYGLKTVKLI
jgi:hypothetical protein